MDFSIRPAQIADVPHLACALMEASGGLVEAVYDGAIPGRETNLIVEHLFSRPNATTTFANCWVAETEERVLGSIHALPMDAMGDDPADPLVRDDRKYLYEPFEHMHAEGSYYILAVAVYPEFRGLGIGRRLMAEAESAARAKGFKETSLNVFSENQGAVRLYETLGYKERARQPVVGHDKIRYGGDYLLMTRVL
ncbi:MAG: GNAT family N-acetyltransferase [Rhodobacteraceae bacterium]|nr:GNAT family N-acetyltransferase [Paracoccaceae bacterium]